MAANAWDSDNVDIALETGIQSPQYVVGIKQINIVVYQDNVFQFRESREGLAEQPVFDGLHQAELF